MARLREPFPPQPRDAACNDGGGSENAVHPNDNAACAHDLPLVSILIVARNTAPFIDAALRSARAQTHRALDIVVVDDGSSDGTCEIAQEHGRLDSRVRVLNGPCKGLSAVRNASLDAARGRWAAILDSDDILHPHHVERLLARARETGAQAVCANMVSFAIDQGRLHTDLFASGAAWQRGRCIDLAEFVRTNSAYGSPVCTGYFKPLLDLQFMRLHGLRYDETLRIAEDYDLVARLLAAGGTYEYLPGPTYFYRRHAGSTSHRQSLPDLAAMLAAAHNVHTTTPEIGRILARRAAGIRTAMRHTRAIAELKSRRPAGAVRALGLDAHSWLQLGQSFAQGVARRAIRVWRRYTGAYHHSSAGPTMLVLGAEQDPGHHHCASIISRALPSDDLQRARLADGMAPGAIVVASHGTSPEDLAFAQLATHSAPTVARLSADQSSQQSLDARRTGNSLAPQVQEAPSRLAFPSGRE